MIQCRPCYSAVSAMLTNPLPDHSNYSPLLPHPLSLSGRINTSLVSSGQTVYQAAPLETKILHCCSTLLQNVVGNSGETQCLEDAEQQAEASAIFLILLFKLLTRFPFVSFLSISILSLLPFAILSLLPLHHPFFLF